MQDAVVTPYSRGRIVLVVIAVVLATLLVGAAYAVASFDEDDCGGA
jgi:hypothetical protein